MNNAPAKRWQRVLQQCTQQLSERWPVRPTTEQPSNQALQSGFLFSGQSHEVVPRRLLLDSRLTPLERNAWQVFRLMLQGQGVDALAQFGESRTRSAQRTSSRFAVRSAR